MNDKKQTDGVTIKTYLRPDLYEFFPRFRLDEIQQRLQFLPFHKASLLTLSNVLTTLSMPEGKATVQAFLKGHVRTQREMLKAVLLQVGIPIHISRAIGKIKRELFYPLEYAPYCYLNHWIPFDSLSCGSWPGLIALMVERLRVEKGQKILEIGIGSGYHAACISESVDNECEIYGIELNKKYLEFGQSALRKCGFNNIHGHYGDGYLGWPSDLQFDRIYMPCALVEEIPPILVQQLREGGIIQIVRAINQNEFESEPENSWLRKNYGNYQQYLSGNWRSYCCLATHIKRGTILEEIDHLYDVTFTPFHRNPNLYEPEHTNPFRKLLSLL